MVLGANPALQYDPTMASDSSNARDSARSPADVQKEPEAAHEDGTLQSGKTPHARILSDPPTSIDPEEEGKALLTDLTVGSVVDGKYRVDQVLGRGAMGVVVAATHLQLGERVALKFLRYRAKGGVNDDFQSRFRREARVSARLKNEHITRVIDVGVWREHVPYMVMDYLEGTDLREVMKAAGAMPIGTAIDYIIQVCEGIAEAHANGVVHRDMKPSNLFVTKRPDGSDLIKILDFGISKWSAGEAAVDELTQTGVVLGSPKYMAPEQLFGSSEVDARADVWSIGAILYEMLCGRPPFDLPSFTKICAELATDHPPPSLVARRSEITPALEAAVMKCFARAPMLRTQSVAELAGDVLDAIQAPFADTVRARIAQTLDPKAPRDGMAGSGARGMHSGSYSAMFAASSVSQSGSMRSPLAPESTGPSPTSISGALAPQKRSWVPWVAGGAVLVLGGILFAAFSGKGEAQQTAVPAPVPIPVVVTVPPAVTTVSAAPPATASATSTATATAAGTPTDSATSTVTSTPATPPRVVRGWRPPPRTSPNTTTPATTAAPTPAPTTPPVATAPPTTPKADPLGDRQ